MDVNIAQVAISAIGVVVAAGVSGVLVRFILAGHATQIAKLEDFKGKVKMPNVGESMCDARHGKHEEMCTERRDQIERGIKFLFDEHKTLISEIKRDHDVVTIVRTKLDSFNKRFDGIDRKLDKLNNKDA